MKKVMDGVRPDRPGTVFTDGLWNLVQLSWSEENEQSQESKRPSVGSILERLQKDSSNWFYTARFHFPTVDSKLLSFSK